MFNNFKEINYKEIFDNIIHVTYNHNELFDINFIITVRGRLNFAQPMYSSFLNACEKTDLKIGYTIVEHSENPEHSKFCKLNKINYMWIKSSPNEMFNKSFAYNIGALFSHKSKYILFHDIDCLIQSDFFILLMDNLKNKNTETIQCFQGRRVLYCNEELTQNIISKKVNVDDLKEGFEGVSLPFCIGAPGGSILVSKQKFLEVGGYDDTFFLGNSPEDAFFWEKIDTVGKMEICDNPKIDIFHMNHPVTYNSNPYINEMKNIFETFKGLSMEEKMQYINKKSENLKKYV